MEIIIQGDFDFAKEVIFGIARLFSGPNGFGYGSGVLVILFLLFNMLKHAIDPEKSTPPVREFVFGLVLWLMVGGAASSAKFDVQLTSGTDNTRFEYVEEVPALAAVPAWIASNLFGAFREKVQATFSPASYSLAGGQDPLGALVRMWQNEPPISIITQNRHEDIEKTLGNYMHDCWAADQLLNHAAPTVTVHDLLNTNMIADDAMLQSLKVDYAGLVTRVYLGTEAEISLGGQPTGLVLTCPDAYNRIVARFSESGAGSAYNKIVAWVDGRQMDANSIKNGMSMISNSYGSSMNPYALQVNLFVATLAAKGVNMNNGVATHAERMLFEGFRKQMYKNLGDGEYIKMVTVPLITALEMFSFFVAPVMMILSILGGLGLAYMGKYLSLVLFMNLWGYTKIFVDLFTALSVEKAYGVMDNAAYTFAAYPDTIREVESFLSVAGALTASISGLTMYLLYGGVHSLMGVMRSMQNSSIDGSAGAPSVSSSMNGGVVQMSNMSMQYDTGSGQLVKGYSSQSDNTVGGMSLNQMVSSSNTSARQTALEAAELSSSQAVQNYQNAFSSAENSADGKTAMDAQSFAASTGAQRTDMLTQQLAKDMKITYSEASDLLFSLAANSGIDAGFNFGMGGKSNKGKQDDPASGDMAFQNLLGAAIGLSAEGRAAIQGSGKISDSETLSRAANILQNFAETNLQGLNKLDQDSYNKQWSKDNTSASSEAYSNAEQAAQSYSSSIKYAESRASTAADVQQVSSSSGLELPNIAAVLDGGLDNRKDYYSEIFAPLMKDPEGAKRLEKLGITDETSLANFAKENQGSLYDGKGLVNTIKALTAGLSSKDGSIEDTKADMGVAGKLWGNLRNSLVEGGADERITNSVANMANVFRNMSGTTGTENAVNTGRTVVEDKIADDNVTIHKKGDGVTGVVNKALTDNEAAVNASKEKIAAAKPEFTEPPKNGVVTNDSMFQQLASSQDPKGVHGSWLVGAAKATGEWAEKAKSFIENGGNAWGGTAQESGQAFQRFMAENGHRSTALNAGFQGLLTADAGMALDFKDNKPSTERAYLMNEAYHALKSPQGQAMLKEMPEGTDKSMLEKNMERFEGFRNSLPAQDREDMDKLAALRATGDVLNSTAEKIIDRNLPGFLNTFGAKEALDVADKKMLMVGEATRNDDSITRLAGITSHDLESNFANNSSFVKVNAASNIIADEMNRMVTEGVFKDASSNLNVHKSGAIGDENLVAGVTDGAVKTIAGNLVSPKEYVQDALSSVDSPAWGTAVPMVAALGVDGVVDRLAGALDQKGFKEEAEQFRAFGTSVVNEASEKDFYLKEPQLSRGPGAMPDPIQSTQVGGPESTVRTASDTSQVERMAVADSPDKAVGGNASEPIQSIQVGGPESTVRTASDTSQVERMAVADSPDKAVGGNALLLNANGEPMELEGGRLQQVETGQTVSIGDNEYVGTSDKYRHDGDDYQVFQNNGESFYFDGNSNKMMRTDN
jgi:hypothetical protein